MVGGKSVCAWKEGWTTVMEYYDDDTTDDIPNTKTEIAAGFTTDNAWYIGNDALNALPIAEAEICMAKARDSGLTDCDEWNPTSAVSSVPSTVGEGTISCFVVGDSDFGYSPSSTYDTLSELMGGTRQIIGVFSGQVDYGATVSGARGKFINAGAITQNSWNCHNYSPYMQQWTGDTSNFHTWGCGLVMDRAKTDDEIVGPGDGYGTCAWYSGNANVDNDGSYPTCNQHHNVAWDSIFVRVRLA